MLYQCSNCLSEFDKATRFCPKCGFHLETGSTENPVCPECKRSFPPHTKYCTNDGTPLESSVHILDSIYYENGYPKASLGNRFLAALLDGLITAGLTIPAGAFFVMAMNKSESYESDGVIGLFAFAVILYVLPMTYSLIKDGLEGGQSWGKRAVGLMVINLGNNMPCNKGKSFVRNIISAIVSVIPFIGWLIEPIIVLADSSGRKLGDRAANTQVIEKLNYR